MTSPSKVRNGTFATDSRGFTSMSQPPGRCARCRRKTSRNRRFSRLRNTAFPKRAGVVIPNRDCDNPLGRTKTVHSGALRRRPSS